MIIDIVRHAETFSNAEGRLQGNSDLLLSKDGIRQAEELGKYLADNYDIIFCSSMKRTQQTLAIALGKSIEESIESVEYYGNIMVSDHLREMDLGNLEGLIVREMTKEQRILWNSLQKEPNFTDHGGEAPIKFFERVDLFFREIKALSEVPEFNKILIVTHNGVLQLIFKFILNIYPPIIHNADVLRFEITPDKFEYMGMNILEAEVEIETTITNNISIS